MGTIIHNLPKIDDQVLQDKFAWLLDNLSSSDWDITVFENTQRGIRIVLYNNFFDFAWDSDYLNMIDTEGQTKPDLDVLSHWIEELEHLLEAWRAYKKWLKELADPDGVGDLIADRTQ